MTMDDMETHRQGAAKRRRQRQAAREAAATARGGERQSDEQGGARATETKRAEDQMAAAVASSIADHDAQLQRAMAACNKLEQFVQAECPEQVLYNPKSDGNCTIEALKMETGRLHLRNAHALARMTSIDSMRKELHRLLQLEENVVELLAHDVPKSDIEKALDDTASRQQNVDIIVISDLLGLLFPNTPAYIGCVCEAEDSGPNVVSSVKRRVGPVSEKPNPNGFVFFFDSSTNHTVCLAK